MYIIRDIQWPFVHNNNLSAIDLSNFVEIYWGWKILGRFEVPFASTKKAIGDL